MRFLEFSFPPADQDPFDRRRKQRRLKKNLDARFPRAVDESGENPRLVRQKTIVFLADVLLHRPAENDLLLVAVQADSHAEEPRWNFRRKLVAALVGERDAKFSAPA